MARGIPTLTTLMIMAPTGVLVMGLADRAEAATPTYYADQMMFQADITSTVTDDYSNPAYVFNQNNATMSGVLGETDYMSTGHNNLNLIVNAADPRYCSGCNGSFELSFQTTSVGTAAGVNGVGLTVDSSDNTYFAFITFADGTTDNIMLPAAGTFWGVAAPERIERIHIGLTMGGTTTGGYFEMDDLIVGDGNVGGCAIDADCFDDGDPCTDQVCIAGLCEFVFNVAPCDDGDLCTMMDTCAGGICGGVIDDCDDGNECTTDTCDPGSGCVIQLNTDPCDDGDLCTEMDACSAGACTGTPIDCNDDDVCSMDSCDPMTGCVSEPEVGCCLVDEDCGEQETCDLDMNACVPIPGGDSSTGAADDDTGDAETGVDSTGDGDSGGGTGVDTGSVDTGFMGSTTGVGGSVTGDPGEIPPPGFNTCECRTSPAPQGRLWWLMAAFGLFVRRRRSAA